MTPFLKFLVILLFFNFSIFELFWWFKKMFDSFFYKSFFLKFYKFSISFPKAFSSKISHKKSEPNFIDSTRGEARDSFLRKKQLHALVSWMTWENPLLLVLNFVYSCEPSYVSYDNLEVDSRIFGINFVWRKRDCWNEILWCLFINSPIFWMPINL